MLVVCRRKSIEDLSIKSEKEIIFESFLIPSLLYGDLRLILGEHMSTLRHRGNASGHSLSKPCVLIVEYLELGSSNIEGDDLETPHVVQTVVDNCTSSLEPRCVTNPGVPAHFIKTL